VNWGLLLGALVALAAPEDALDDLSRSFWERGQRLEADGDLSGAALAYRMTHQRQPTWTRALLAEARAWADAGRTDRALSALERAPFDADAVEARGRLLLEDDPEAAVDAFVRLRRLRPEWPEVDLLIAAARVRVDPLSALPVLQRYLEHPEADLGLEEGVDTVVRLLGGLQEAGRVEEAAELAVRVARRFAEVPGVERVDALRLRYEVAEEARALASAAGLPLSPVGVEALAQARDAAFSGRVDRAAAQLRELVRTEPRAALAWASLARVEEQLGRIDEAVAAAAMAETLDPVEADHSAQLGELYAAHFGGRLDVRAARAYGRAVQRRGSDAELWYRKATLERRAGWTSEAADSYRRALSLDPSGPHAADARRHLDGLQRPLPAPVDVPEGQVGRPSSVPQVAWDSLHRAWAWQRRRPLQGPEVLDEALAEVAVARRTAPSWVRAINLEAAIRLDRGDTDEALQLYRRSLQVDPAQGSVHRMVAELLASSDPAASRASLDRAADLGEPTAVLRRAEARAAAGQLWAARADLQRYRGLTVRGVEQAAALDRRLATQQAVVVGGAGAAVVGLFATPLWWWRRQRGGVGLVALLERSPSRFGHVAAALAGLRHEVLKHHTTVLDEVADALQAGDDDTLRWAVEHLYGDEGALPRFHRYLQGLKQLGDEAGVRLNLAHRDPVFAPLIDAMAQLQGLQRSIERGDAGAARSLRQLSIALNIDAYRGLGRYLQQLCLVDIDEGLVQEAWRSVRREGAFREGPAELTLVDSVSGPLWVRAYRSDLLDVLTNLLRNALEASSAAGQPRVGVRLDVDEDWVTGLERVQIAVLDRSPRRLTTAMVRGRFVGRGLGLAVDLVTRAGGSVHVEDDDEWCKAVVVRLPRVERPEEEVA
jgi:tetratricopeptide (TPR) repeat protein